MATSRILPSSNPYASGATVLDSTPYTQYYLNQQAKQQAKEEALDNYFKTLDSKINPAGMRTQEIPILLQQQNADREFYQKNKDKIRNPAKDNGQAYNEFMARQQSKLAFVEKSKKQADVYRQLVPIFADPNKRALMADEAISALQAHDLPITDPRHKEFDITSINYNPKPFDVLSYQKKIPVKEVAGETIFENMPDYKTSFLRTPKTKITQQFDKDQIAKIAESEYTQNPSYRKLINDIGNNPTQYQIHNDIYKKFFGKNLDIQHPEQIAVAHTLSLLPKDYEKAGIPKVDEMAAWLAKNKITSSQADRRAALRAAQKPPETYDFLKKGADVLVTGNPTLANQYFSAWKAQNKTGGAGDIIGFDKIDYLPSGDISIKYNVPITKSGVTVGLPQETVLNPKDPQLLNKITGLHQQFLGSDVKVEKAAQKESLKGAVEKTATFKFPNGKTKF